MSKRIRPLTPQDIEHLGAAWSEVGWFVVDPVTRGRLTPDELFDVKQRWFLDVSSAWGTCGLALPSVAGADTLSGYAIFAPAGLAPGRDVPPTAPASSDAVVLLELWADPHQLVGVVEKILVQSVAAELVHRGGVEALEAFALRAGDHPEFLSEALLNSLGFHVKREHQSVPRLRMELKGTRRWVEEVEEAWERLKSGVRGHKEPATGKPAAGPMRGS